MIFSRYKKLLILLAVILAMLLGFLVYQSLQFRMTNTTPNHKKYPASLSTLDVSFSKKLDKAALEERIEDDIKQIVSVNFESDVTASIDDNKLQLRFSRTPLPGDYEIKLNDIRSEKGQVIDVSLPFNVRDIPYEEMSKEEQALHDQLITEGITDNISEYPLLEKLPYETEKYHVSYRYDHDSDPAPILVITMKFFEPGSVALPATQAEKDAYLRDIRTYRTQALDWLMSQGASFDTYTLEYTEPDLVEEFPTGRGRNFDLEVQDGHGTSYTEDDVR